jgi:hypothetical protein
VSSLSLLNNESLLNAYQHAIQIGLSQSFIELLLAELQTRQMKFE